MTGKRPSAGSQAKIDSRRPNQLAKSAPDTWSHIVMPPGSAHGRLQPRYPSLTEGHRCGLPLEVDNGFAAAVEAHPADGTAGRRPEVANRTGSTSLLELATVRLGGPGAIPVAGESGGG